MVRCFDNRKKPLGTASSRYRRRRPTHLTFTAPPKVYWQSADGATILDGGAATTTAAVVVARQDDVAPAMKSDTMRESDDVSMTSSTAGVTAVVAQQQLAEDKAFRTRQTIEQTQQQIEVWKEDCRLKDVQIQQLQRQVAQLQQQTKPQKAAAPEHVQVMLSPEQILLQQQQQYEKELQQLNDSHQAAMEALRRDHLDALAAVQTREQDAQERNELAAVQDLQQQQLLQSQQKHKQILHEYEERESTRHEQMTNLQQQLHEAQLQFQQQQRLHQQERQEWKQRESELLEQMDELVRQIAARPGNSQDRHKISPPTPATFLSNPIDSTTPPHVQTSRLLNTAPTKTAPVSSRLLVTKQVLSPRQPSSTNVVRRRNTTIAKTRNGRCTSWLSSLNREQERWQRVPLTFCGQTLHLSGNRRMEIDSPSSSSTDRHVDRADLEEDI